MHHAHNSAQDLRDSTCFSATLPRNVIHSQDLHKSRARTSQTLQTVWSPCCPCISWQCMCFASTATFCVGRVILGRFSSLHRTTFLCRAHLPQVPQSSPLSVGFSNQLFISRCCSLIVEYVIVEYVSGKKFHRGRGWTTCVLSPG